jgi:hypothetical protein
MGAGSARYIPRPNLRLSWSHRSMSNSTKLDSLRLRFRAKVYKRGPHLIHMPTRCWMWVGGRSKNGYGRLKERGFWILAHRRSWELHRGAIPVGLLVCHHCDNPSCVRPSHLFVGTDADNKADCVAKGRQARGAKCAPINPNPPVLQGMKHGRAKLTDAIVLQIRAECAAGEFQHVVAKRHGVCQAMVNHIVTRKRWGHLP